MRLSTFSAMLCFSLYMFTSASSEAQTAGGSTPVAPVNGSTKFNLWWHSNSALATFLKTQHAGVSIIGSGSTPSPMASAIVAGKYALMEGLGGYAAQWAQGYDNPAYAAAIKSDIDKIASQGGTYIYVDEPWPAPGQSTATSAASIAYNVKGFNILYSYIHSKWPGVQFGLTIGDGGGPGLHLAMLQAGLHEDFSSEEEYNSCCRTGNPFIAQKKQFPNVKTMSLFYSTQSLCQNNGAWPGSAATSGLDIIAFWDVDNYGDWIGPLMDASWLQNAQTFAQTGSTTSFCTLPVSEVNPDYWTWATKNTNFTVGTWDRYWQTPTPYTIASCDYKVVSGPNAINGPSDPLNVVTLDWTPRTCNGNLTITVGANANCRHVGNQTCLVFTRAKTSTGLYGNTTYQEYSVAY